MPISWSQKHQWERLNSMNLLLEEKQFLKYCWKPILSSSTKMVFFVWNDFYLRNVTWFTLQMFLKVKWKLTAWRPIVLTGSNSSFLSDKEIEIFDSCFWGKHVSQELGSTSSNSSSYHVRVHVSKWYVCVSSVYFFKLSSGQGFPPGCFPQAMAYAGLNSG